MSSDEEEWNDNHDENGEKQKKTKAQNGTAALNHPTNDNDDDDDDDDDDMPLSTLKSPRVSKKAAPSYKEASDNDDNDDDNDDDVPLISLVANSNKRKRDSTSSSNKDPPKKKQSTSKKETSKKSPATKKSTDKKKKKATTPTKPSPVKSKSSSSTSVVTSSSSNKSYEWVSAALYGSGCDKGLLIQRLLCRWWYAYTWPDLDHPVQPIPDLKQYDALDGFPGVYIGTAAEVVGQMYDTRDLSKAPSFRNFAHTSSGELQQLLITAIEEQKRQLLSHHQQGMNSADASHNNDDVTIKDLDTILKWTRKVNTNKADKDAMTVLKAHGLKL